MMLAGKDDTCWASAAPNTAYPTLLDNGATDVVIIGGGIVGLTTAYVLTKAGVSVTLLEARRIGRQVSGRSTAKITSQHALIYKYLIDAFGFEAAHRYAAANRAGSRQIRAWVNELGIVCDYEAKDAYTYTIDRARLSEIQAEAEAARTVGFDADVLARAPLPFATAGALRFRGEAQFNPLSYLIGLATAINDRGGRLFERTRVLSVEPGSRWKVKAGNVTLEAQHVVIATNLPMAGTIAFDERTRPRCHIAMAFRAEPNTVDGMFIGVDEPTHSLRMGRDDKGPLLIALGPTFTTGQDGDVAARFGELDTWVRENLPVGETAWRWVNEDYNTPDRVPYAGRADTGEGFYVATGFNGWGISNGTAAGLLIADQILGRANAWAALYDPSRKIPRGFNQGGDTKSRLLSVDDIVPGQGGIVKVGTEDLAIWKEENGSVHAFSAACTHKGCTLTWNNADQTWDCPCHGSIFASDGSIIHGPAVEPLASRRYP